MFNLLYSMARTDWSKLPSTGVYMNYSCPGFSIWSSHCMKYKCQIISFNM